MNAKITKSQMLEFLRYGTNSVVVLCFKLLLVWLLTLWLNAYWAYFWTHICVFLFSYTIHSKYSFRSEMTLSSLKRYFLAVIAIKIFDYLIFAVAFTYFQITALASVIVATLVIAVMRFFLARSALRPQGGIS